MKPITATTLLKSLPSIVGRVRPGGRLTVSYRGRPAFLIVPLVEANRTPVPLEHDTLYRAKAVGRSKSRRRN